MHNSNYRSSSVKRLLILAFAGSFVVNVSMAGGKEAANNKVKFQKHQHCHSHTHKHGANKNNHVHRHCHTHSHFYKDPKHKFERNISMHNLLNHGHQHRAAHKIKPGENKVATGKTEPAKKTAETKAK